MAVYHKRRTKKMEVIRDGMDGKPPPEQARNGRVNFLVDIPDARRITKRLIVGGQFSDDDDEAQEAKLDEVAPVGTDHADLLLSIRNSASGSTVIPPSTSLSMMSGGGLFQPRSFNNDLCVSRQSISTHIEQQLPIVNKRKLLPRSSRPKPLKTREVTPEEVTIEEVKRARGASSLSKDARFIYPVNAYNPPSSYQHHLQHQPRNTSAPYAPPPFALSLWRRGIPDSFFPSDTTSGAEFIPRGAGESDEKVALKKTRPEKKVEKVPPPKLFTSNPKEVAILSAARIQIDRPLPTLDAHPSLESNETSVDLLERCLGEIREETAKQHTEEVSSNLDVTKMNLNEKDGIIEPHPYCDILLGRGGGVNYHPANVRLRHLVQHFRDLYITAPRKEKPELSKVRNSFILLPYFTHLSNIFILIGLCVKDYIKSHSSMEAKRSFHKVESRRAKLFRCWNTKGDRKNFTIISRKTERY